MQTQNIVLNYKFDKTNNTRVDSAKHKFAIWYIGKRVKQILNDILLNYNTICSNKNNIITRRYIRV